MTSRSLFIPIFLFLCVSTSISLVGNTRQNEVIFSGNLTQLNAFSRSYTNRGVHISERFNTSSSIPGIGIQFSFPIFKKWRWVFGYTQCLQTFDATYQSFSNGTLLATRNDTYSMGIGHIGLLFEYTPKWDLYFGSNIPSLFRVNTKKQLVGENGLYVGINYKVYPNASLYMEYRHLKTDELPKMASIPSYDTHIFSTGLHYVFRY